MLNSWQMRKAFFQAIKRKAISIQQTRHVTALYITGDKAKENYATLHPYMEFGKLNEREALDYSITKRKLNKQINLDEILRLYQVYKQRKAEIDLVEETREKVAQNLKDLSKKTAIPAAEVESIKTSGKLLRQQQKTLREAFYPIEDEFAHAYLSIPNNLHANCGIDGKEKLIFRNGLPSNSTDCKSSHLERTDLLRFMNNDRYYLFGDAAKFDIYATQALCRYFVHQGKFLQTSNPDFVRCVLLEANATPIEQYHKVEEQQLQNQLNCAYLTGGASFESFLANVTRLSVFPNVLPLQYVCCGRSYEKTNMIASQRSNLYTATQTNAVQTFAAAETAHEADEQFENILNLAIDFYKTLGLHFRIVYVDASVLTASESLRASIEVFSPAEERYVCVGKVSNYGDYVSKRILFCTRRQKEYHFLHLVGGPVLYTTPLIAALIENGLDLNYSRLLGVFNAQKSENNVNVINEFKDVFK